MKALVALRKVVSNRLVRERAEEKEARSSSDAKLVELSGKHSALLRTSATQQEKIARMEADVETLRTTEARLRERGIQLEAQNIAIEASQHRKWRKIRRMKQLLARQQSLKS